MIEKTKLLEALDRMASIGASGYAIALHVRFVSPRILLESYPAAWATYYSAHALVLSDPTVAWGLANTGSCRWGDLPGRDLPIMQRARRFGLHHGVVCAIEDGGSRSIASVARHDRDCADQEIEAMRNALALLHAATGDLHQSDPDLVKILQARVAIHKSALPSLTAD